MPGTAKLSRKFYDTFGDKFANELVEWFNQVDATYRGDLRELNELNFGRFDAKLEQRVAELDAKIEQRYEQLDAQVLDLDTEFCLRDTEFCLRDTEFCLRVQQPPLELFLEPPEMRVEQLSQFRAVRGFNRIQAVHQLIRELVTELFIELPRQLGHRHAGSLMF